MRAMRYGGSGSLGARRAAMRYASIARNRPSGIRRAYASPTANIAPWVVGGSLHLSLRDFDGLLDRIRLESRAESERKDEDGEHGRASPLIPQCSGSVEGGESRVGPSCTKPFCTSVSGDRLLKGQALKPLLVSPCSAVLLFAREASPARGSAEGRRCRDDPRCSGPPAGVTLIMLICGPSAHDER